MAKNSARISNQRELLASGLAAEEIINIIEAENDSSPSSGRVSKRSFTPAGSTVYIKHDNATSHTLYGTKSIQCSHSGPIQQAIKFCDLRLDENALRKLQVAFNSNNT